jgi:hypothetical protein
MRVLGLMGLVEPEVDMGDWDGGVRDIAPPSTSDPGAEHGDFVVNLLERAKQERWGA